jgi:hypothetical protein
MRWQAGLEMAAAVVLMTTTAVAVDLHAFWDGRCLECHGHAGDFARRHMTVENGTLLGRHHRRDLIEFLGRHEMGPELAPALYQMLLAQAKTQPRFEQKCAGCHGSAAEFVRSSIDRQASSLVSKRSGRAVADILKNHGGLSAEDQASMITTLDRVYSEVHRAP